MTTIRAIVIGPVLALVLVTATAAAAPPERQTPRATVMGFLADARAGNWQGAAAYLDLSAIEASRRPAQGPRLARELAVVLERAVALDPDSLSEVADGDREDGLPAPVERLGTVATGHGPVDLLLRRSPGPDGGWLFAARTVALVPSLHEEFGPGVLETLIPRPLLEIRLFALALWQWIGLLLLLLVAWVGSWIAITVLVRVSRPFVARSTSALAESLIAGLASPMRFGLALLAFALGAVALALPLAAGSLVTGAEKAVAVLVVAWALLRVVDVLATVAGTHLMARGQAAAVAMVPLGGKALKAVILCFATLAMLQNLGMNVTGLLAGLGIGGLAVALAAQKTVENLFGGITLIADQPVRVGDFCRFGERVGTIEDIGLRSTRVRTLERTVVSVPNAEFSALQIETFSARDRIWLHTTIGLRYETTPDQLRYVLVEIRKLLYAHPRVATEPARIRFVGFGAYSLDCEIFAYVLTASYDEFLAVREDILLRIMDVVTSSGASFAFPSQTLYVGQDAGPDEARRGAAEAAVRGWRERGAMCLPDFPAEQIAAIRDTLEYPPNGAATRRPPA